MNFRTLDLNLLRVFDAVMTERQVTRAAEHLAMSQPAVSNALRRLREALGEELFIPGSTGVIPTRHAEALWPTVRRALESLRASIEPASFDPVRDERGFIVAMADATASVLMPALLARWTAWQRGPVLQVVGLDSRDPRPMLEHGQADAAVGFFPDVERELAAQGDAGTTHLDPLYECDYVCVMRAGHPLATRPELTLEDYCASAHLRVNFAGRPRGFVDEALHERGAARRIAVTVEHFSTVGPALQRSDLLAVLPLSYVPNAGVDGALVVRALPFALPRIRVALLWHRRHAQDAGQRWLRERLLQAAAEVEASLPRAT